MEDQPHNPWTPEWNAKFCSGRFWSSCHKGECACGIFEPPPLIPAMAALLPKPAGAWHWPSRGGLCTVSLDNREFNFVWAARSGPCLMWDAKTQLYKMRRQFRWSEVPVVAPTQTEVLALFVAKQLEGGQ